MNMRLFRLRNNQHGCFGLLFAGPNREGFATAELPYRDNAPSASSIPIGEYPYEYLVRSASGKYKNVFWIKEVSGRSAILIHQGNIPQRDSRGCILVGLRHLVNDEGEVYGVYPSLPAIKRLADLGLINGRIAVSDYVRNEW